MKAEVAALLDKAASSRRAAALLAAQDYLDFAASRAYYALFYKGSGDSVIYPSLTAWLGWSNHF